MPRNTSINSGPSPNVHTELQNAYDEVFNAGFLSKVNSGRTTKKKGALVSLLKSILVQSNQNRTDVPPTKKLKDMNIRSLNIEQACAYLLQSPILRRVATKIENDDPNLTSGELKQVTK